MPFFDELELATREDREALFDIPFVRAALDGDIDRETYVAFLTEAYHHVKHTLPLLMAVGAALPERYEWLRKSVAHYIEEETGHQEWILDDIKACGADAEAVRRGRAGPACELMVAYAWDTVHRGNPLGFFGMVHVLEGTSVRAATRAADAIRARLGLPATAFRYLTTHGDLDQDHVGFFRTLMDRIEDPADRECIVHRSHVFFRLYGDIFRSLLPAHTSVGAGAGR